ncbi:MAG: GTP-binding protein [Candidatus Micrarchaeales archaeon]
MLIRNITLLGHKDHGKSTLIGSLLIQTDSILPAKIEEAKRMSKKLKKPFEPGFILDSFHEEREQGRTIEAARAEVQYRRQMFTLIDVPGHEELIKNMISGASAGDLALLLVSAKADEGIKKQTKRHIYIAKMLGIDKMVVAVNKLDLIKYDQKRFNEISAEIGEFMDTIGFDRKNVHFIPISAYNAENIITKSKNLRWYKGKTLMEQLYANSKQNANANGPLRIILQGKIAGDVVIGNVVSGSVKVGEHVRIQSIPETVKSIVVKGKNVKRANTGVNVAVSLDKKVDAARGSVISSAADPIVPRKELNARIFVTGKIGSKPRISFNGVETQCNSIKIQKRIDTTTGLEAKAKQSDLLNAIRARISLKNSIPMEKFEKTKELGRFVVYNGKTFAGIGVVEN